MANKEVVTPQAWSFVAECYDEWWESFGITLAADPSRPFGDGSEIDVLWNEYQSQSKS